MGSGAYGDVAFAINVETNEKVAIKRMPKILHVSAANLFMTCSIFGANGSPRLIPSTIKPCLYFFFPHKHHLYINTNIPKNAVDAIRILREMYILRNMNHPNIINLIDVIMPESYDGFEDLYMVFEHVDTDLFKIILSQQALSLLHIQAFIFQLLNGLKYLKNIRVIHRDIKPANVLLTENCTLKICDFGLARIVSKDRLQCCSAEACEKCGGNKRNLVEGAEVGKAPAAVDTDVTEGGLQSTGLGTNSSTSSTSGEGATGTSSSSAAGSKPFKKPAFVKKLTQHVATRWYRAPELILLQPYTNAVDIWAAGCIFAELLSVHEDHVDPESGGIKSTKNHSLFTTGRANKALFPGGSCFPLSARAGETFELPLDQLNMIFDVIGTPSREEIVHLGKVRQYLKTIDKKPPINFAEKWPNAGADAIDLLKKMLNFVADRRITVEEALQHEFLAPVRDALSHEGSVTDINTDFIESLSTTEELKRAIYNEILEWHPTAKGGAKGRR